MVKLVNIIIAFAVFSSVVSMFFLAIADGIEQNEIDNPIALAQFQILSGEYEVLATQEFGEDSTTRQIVRTTKQGDSGSEDNANFLVSGALGAGRLTINFFGNFENIVTGAAADAKDGGNYISPIIINTGIAILLILGAFAVVHFLRGAKTET